MGWGHRNGGLQPTAQGVSSLALQEEALALLTLVLLSWPLQVNIHVYERRRGGFKRISCFDVPSPKAILHVLYCGGIHYDALVVNSLRGVTNSGARVHGGKRARCEGAFISGVHDGGNTLAFK